MTINKNMTIGNLIKQYPETAEVLFSYGMGCIGCPSSQSETIEQASMVHGIDLNSLMAELSEKVGG
jgi:hybrid cluster-associated redox disulfide protein